MSDPVENKILNSLIRQIVARDTYAMTSDVSAERLTSSEKAKAIIYSNRKDLEVYTASLCLRASGSFAPVIRLPLSPNLAFHELAQLASAIRHDRGTSPHKLNRLAKALSYRLARGLPEWVFQQLRESPRVKVIADAPLEWMDLDGFPLMLRADVSRITITPGNLFIQQAVSGMEVPIHCKLFKEVLVIRSFQSRDPIKPLLERAIDCYRTGSKNFPSVRIVDVQNRKELEAAINSFNGALMVFDGHGAHPFGSDAGHLALTDEQIDPWTLRGSIRVPPIVVLAACDTHPLDASHATSANGFLAAGAHTVVATGVPIGAVEAAVFVARLLLRVGEYLPLLMKRRHLKSFRWSEIIPGLQRREYTSEALRRLARVGGVSLKPKQIVSIMLRVGMAIDTGGDWLTMLAQEIQAASGWPLERAFEELSRQAAYVDALAFTQLGNPELLVGYELSDSRAKARRTSGRRRK